MTQQKTAFQKKIEEITGIEYRCLTGQLIFIGYHVDQGRQANCVCSQHRRIKHVYTIGVKDKDDVRFQLGSTCVKKLYDDFKSGHFIEGIQVTRGGRIKCQVDPKPLVVYSPGQQLRARRKRGGCCISCGKGSGETLAIVNGMCVSCFLKYNLKV
jgi:hypothetical protein